MNKENTEFFEETEEWFTAISDRTESGLRDFLKGERPADAGASVTRKINNKSALLLFNYDVEMMRYKLQREFSKSAVFNRREVKYLKKTFDLEDFQAEAVRFANLLILRNEYVKDCMKILDEFIASILSVAFKTIGQDGIPRALNEFRKASNNTKNTLVEGIGMSYVERLKQNAHLFTKTPNIGRPSDTKDKADKITSAIKQLFVESFGSINESNVKDILNGKIPTPKITKSKVASRLKVSRPQFDIWLDKSKLNFRERVNHVQDEFYKELKKQSRLD